MRKRFHVTVKPAFTAFTALILFVYGNYSTAQETYDLEISFPGKSQVRVSSNVDHNGDVVLLNEEAEANEKLKFLPLQVKGKVNFYQRATGNGQVIRYYEKSAAQIQLEKSKTQNVLTKDNRLIIARIKSDSGKQVEFASILSTLEQPELELINGVADPLTIAAVFNRDAIKTGDSWAPKTSALAKFLNVRKITKSDFKIHAKKVDAKTARLHIKGYVEADVADVATDMTINGVVLVDLKSKLLSSLKMSIEEKRGPGQVAPGFDGKTVLDMRVTAKTSSPYLSDDALARHTKGRTIRQRLKWVSKLGSFVLTYDPRWKMIASEDEAAVLRFLDGGRLISQCNVVLLPRRPADRPITLDNYKKQVQSIVEQDENASLVKASTSTTDSGNTAIRVVVAGNEDGVPIEWNYYHVSAPDGRQITFVFTMESVVAERVAMHSKRLVNEFQFTKQKEAVAQTIGDQPTSRK